MDLTNRSFLKLLDYTPEEVEGLLDLAADLKAKKKAGIRHDALRGKNIALIFEKTSTRTRCSFEAVSYTHLIVAQMGKACLAHDALGHQTACLRASRCRCAARSWQTCRLQAVTPLP